MLDANEYFLKGSGSPRPVIQQNIFGGSLGGPVSPGGKLGFFFVNYQGTRQRSGDSPGTLISTFIPYVPATDRGARERERIWRQILACRRLILWRSICWRFRAISLERPRMDICFRCRMWRQEPRRDPGAVHGQQAGEVYGRPVHGELGS